MQKKTNFKGKEYYFRIRKRFKELKDKELKYREVKIKTEIEEQFRRTDYCIYRWYDKFEQKEMKKIRQIRKI